MPLEMNTVSYRYPNGPWIVENLDFKIRPGEKVGIFGPSGCGKSTLARLMAGYVRPDSGTVQHGGNPVPAKGFNPIQWIGQHPEKAVNPRWRMHKTLNEGFQFRRDDRLLDLLGIDRAWLDRWPNELSAGELQRFCLARALSPETRYLIADEISTMLDPVTQAQIWAVLLKLVEKRNLGLVAISHDMELLSRVCDRILDWDSIGIQ